MDIRKKSKAIRAAYQEWWAEKWDSELDAYLGSVWYRQINGDMYEKLNVMEQVTRNVYSNFVQQCLAKPKAPSKKKYLPQMLLFPDLVFNRKGGIRKSLRNIPNAGLAYHFLCFHRPSSRVSDLVEHFREKQEWYRKRIPELEDIDVVPVGYTPERCVNYMFKYWGKGTFDSSRVLILPDY